jgi:predicted metal-dependent hydrolase
MKRNLNEYLQKCLEMCDKCDIPYRKIDSIVEDKAKKRWGQCRHRNGKIIIGISYQLVDSTYSENDTGLINTIIHEILHTCDGCSNHGKLWKSYADRIYKQYGIEIKRTSTYEEKQVNEEIKENESKYAVQCKKCGKVFPYYRMGKVVKHPENFNHLQCGNGELKRIR